MDIKLEKHRNIYIIVHKRLILIYKSQKIKVK